MNVGAVPGFVAGAAITALHAMRASVEAPRRDLTLAAQAATQPAPPYKGGWPSAVLTVQSAGTAELFAPMHNINAVEVASQRYAALVRHAFQGVNAALVFEIAKARDA